METPEQAESEVTEAPIQEQSMEDRIAAQFDDGEPEESQETASEAPDDDIEAEEGVSEGEEEIAAQDDSAPDTVEIEVDGETLEVPAKYKDHFLRQEDYTQKTQEVAAQRKELEYQQQTQEALRAQYEFGQSIQPELTEIAALDNMLEQAKNLDWQSLTTDQMYRARMEVDQIKDQKAELVEALSAKQVEHQKSQEQLQTELLNKGAEVLKATIPNWDAAKQTSMVEYAKSDGYTDQEIGTITDPRFVRTLWKAAQYEKLQKGTEAAKVVAKNAPIIKPKASSKKMTDSDKNRLALHKAKKNAKSSSELANSQAFQDRVAGLFDT